MAKYLTTWRNNPSAPWPVDPAEITKLWEMWIAGMDDALKNGQVLEFGWFLDGISGYAIATGEAKEQFMAAFANYPWIEMDVREILPYEAGKEIMGQVLKFQAEQMAAMKR